MKEIVQGLSNHRCAVKLKVRETEGGKQEGDRGAERVFGERPRESKRKRLAETAGTLKESKGFACVCGHQGRNDFLYHFLSFFLTL